jgi:hypothetical protein
VGGLRRVATIALFDVMRAYGSTGALINLVLVPVVAALGLMTLFGSSQGQHRELVVVDEDGGPVAGAFVDALAAVPYAVVTLSRQEAADAVSAGARRVAVVLPAGFGATAQPGAFALEVLGRDGDEADAAMAHVGWPRVVAARAAEGQPPAGAVLTLEAPRGGEHHRDVASMRLAFAVFVVVALYVSIGRGATFQRERSAGRLARTVATGVPYVEVVAALVVGLLLVGGVQAAVFFVATAAVGLPWLAGGSAAFVVTVAATLVAVAGVAAAVTGFARTEAQVQVWTFAAPTLFAMLGGAFWPLDGSPGALQQAARLSPMYWSLDALAGGVVYEGWPSQVVPVSVLVLVAVVGMVAGVQALRRTRL